MPYVSRRVAVCDWPDCDIESLDPADADVEQYTIEFPRGAGKGKYLLCERHSKALWEIHDEIKKGTQARAVRGSRLAVVSEDDIPKRRTK